MKLKKQFTFLITSIILIPLICFVFLMIENYLHSPKRYLIKGYREAEKIEVNNSDYADAINIISFIPPAVKSCLIDSEKATVIYNNIPELNNVYTLDAVWDTLEITSKEYFYQFTSPNTKVQTILITRIPRKTPKQSVGEKIVFSVLVFFIIGIVICIISILIISKTIFNSIIKINNQTKEIANGNLNTPLISEKPLKKENEILSILENIEAMRQSLYEAENRKNNFIMGISHDLKTPVAIIKGYLEALKDNVINTKEGIQEALGLMESKANQLEFMINDLINYTKLNKYELQENMKEECISDLLNYFSKEAKLSAVVFNRIVSYKVDIKKDIKITMNKKLIYRALTNLITNAIRYTKDGDKISLNAYVNDNKIWIEICDTGIGISKKDLPHIFDLFYKNSNSRKGNSMGIGLSVVKSIIDAHGWYISVQSEKDVGTCFTIKIPLNN